MNDSKAFIEYLNDLDDIYKNIEEYNLKKKQRRILFVFDDMISDILSNKKLNLMVAKLFIRGRKLNISLVFITQSCKSCNNIMLNCSHYFIMKIANKDELHKLHLTIYQILTFKVL